MAFPKTKRVKVGDFVIAKRDKPFYTGKVSDFYICVVQQTGRGGSLVKLSHLSGDVFFDDDVVKLWVYPKDQYSVDKKQIVFDDGSHRFFKTFKDAENLIKKK